MARRTRSPHPGIVLIPPDLTGRHPHWRARYDDPDSGKRVKVTIDPVAVRTAEGRREWAVRRSRAIAKRRLELDGGAPRATNTALGAAVKVFFDDHVQLRPRTLVIYRRAADQFVEWSTRQGVKIADEVTLDRLVAFRAARVKEAKHAAVREAKRGTKHATKEHRSPATVNVELGSLRTVLGYLRKRALLPRLTSDDLTDGLEKLREPVERAEHLRPADLQRLLDAAHRHDADTFAATREEHATGRSKTTPRFEKEIAPYIAVMLLTGMRSGEGLALDWAAVDLGALDDAGNKVGEIQISGASKTGRARTIGLEVSPACRTILAALKLRHGGRGPVFRLNEHEIKAARKRLVKRFGAPPAFTWQVLRQSCATFLVNTPGIYGSAAPYRESRQLGHSVAVAERSYVGLVRGIAPSAKSLEAAMQVETPIATIIDAIGTRSGSNRVEMRKKRRAVD